MTDTATETGPLSFEQAVALATPQRDPEPTAETAPEAPIEAAEEPNQSEAEATPAEDDASEPAEAGDGDEEAQADEPEAPEVDPPAWWTAEQKARFKELPSDLQAVVQEQERNRERIVSEAKERAAQAEKTAQKELEGVQKLTEHLATFLTDAVQTFQSRWGAEEPDWGQVAEQYGADEAFKLKAQYDREQKTLAQTAQAAQKAQMVAHEATLKQQWEALATVEPELAPDVKDPTQGAEKRQAVIKHLEGRGVPRDAIPHISAVEMSIAYDAMRWRESVAKLKAAPPPKPAAPPPRTPVRPAASAPAPNPTKQALGRFHAKPDVDNAVALLLASKR